MKENMFLMAKQAGASLAKAKQAVSDLPLRASLAVVALAGPAAAMAEEADFLPQITAAGLKIVAYAAAVVGIMVSFWAVKRAGQKMGWW